MYIKKYNLITICIKKVQTDYNMYKEVQTDYYYRGININVLSSVHCTYTVECKGKHS